MHMIEVETLEATSCTCTLLLFYVVSRSGVGSHYGTFTGPVSAFSAANRPKQKYKPPGKNFITNPGKIGTGYG